MAAPTPFHLWSGDFAEARELLDQFVPPSAPMSLSEPIVEPDEPPLFTERTEPFDWGAHAEDLTLRARQMRRTHRGSSVCHGYVRN